MASRRRAVAESATTIDGAPWGRDTFRFCLRTDAPARAAAWLERGWKGALDDMAAWLESSPPGDPFAAVVGLSLRGEITADRATQVFTSICDHRRSGFEEKKAMLGGWAESVAGIGPSGEPEADLLLWRTAWSPRLAPPPPPDADIHSADIGGLFRVLEDRRGGIAHAGFQVCDAFLERLPAEFDSEANGFAVAVLRDELIVEGKVYDTYKGLFTAILEIMHWPAMAGSAGTRIESSLLGVACERRTSYTISQAASSMPGTLPSYFA